VIILRNRRVKIHGILQPIRGDLRHYFTRVREIPV
jgi:hypothetical protein